MEVSLIVTCYSDNIERLQVRTLIHDYLTDEQQGSITGRNPISSINEILREGRYARDKGKVRLS